VVNLIDTNMLTFICFFTFKCVYLPRR